MLVDNSKKMLEEALRVVKPGSSLAFTIWGRKESVKAFDLLETVLARHDLLPKEPPKRTNFDLGRDPEALKSLMHSLGYANVRMWY